MNRLLRLINNYRLQAAEPAAAGAAADGAADTAAGAADGAAATTDTPPAGDTPSALAGGGVSLAERFPEKYRVFSGEGDAAAFDINASAAKLADGYANLERRQGAGIDAPPESPDGYELNGEAIGEQFNAAEFMADETNKGFLKKCHAHGLNNNQVQMVLDHALTEFAPQLMGGEQQLSADQCVESLRETWAGDEYQQNMNSASRAFNALPAELKAEVDKALGNNPLFAQVLAQFGAEMAEDSPPANVPVAGGFDVEAAMLSEAYQNPKHPEHEAVSKQVQAYFAKKYPGDAA